MSEFKIPLQALKGRGARDGAHPGDARRQGSGPWADLIRQHFHKACARHGLNRERIALDLSRFRPGLSVGQGSPSSWARS